MQIVHILTQYSKLYEPFSYYYHGDDIQGGTRVSVTFNKRDIVGYVVNVETTTLSQEEASKAMGIELSTINYVLDHTPLLTEELMTLSDNLASYYFASKITVLQTMLPPSLRPAKSALRQPKIARDLIATPAAKPLVLLTVKQQALYDNVVKNGKMKVTSTNRTIMKTLARKGMITLSYEEKYRYQFAQYAAEEIKQLTPLQHEAIAAFFKSSEETFLLEGITGSGKTEIYLAIAEQIIAHGKSVVMLVPEISLTGMMVAQFSKRFGANIAILHSGLTAAEKYDEYRRIKAGLVQIVVGARSAIFAPLANIGLFIIDEEHAETYKQESEPYYHALTVAQMRAKTFNARVLLGSATPNIETRARADRGNYGYFYLGERINKMALPTTEIVNMLDIKNISINSPFISKALEQAISETLIHGEQVILLVNRRGYAPSVSCRHCGAIKRCSECGLPLVYHKKDNIFKCHSCGLDYPYTNVCDVCGKSALRFRGFGTQKAEEDMRKVFPAARILRLDSDTSKKRQNTQTILNTFANREADILIGTQMVAKGHDFPAVTLVGVLGVDNALALPLFRASETTFQLITQAIGRAGRDLQKGKAIIQSTIMDHYALLCAREQNYQKFYQKEMAMRKMAHNPPYFYLLSLTLSHKEEVKLYETINILRQQLVKALGAEAEVVGPIPHLYVPVKNSYEAHLLLKYRNYFKIKPYLLKTLRPLFGNSAFNLKINVDPYNV